jgi:Lrp/AsnC family transcriptional regulator, leucine-responsive regulatory protein
MPKITLDDFDKRIITALQNDARMTNLALADAVGLSPTPCLRRTKRLEESGVITGYRADLDRKILGLGFTVFCWVKVSRHNDTEAKEFVAAACSWSQVISCQLVSGEVDFMLEVVTEDPEAYQEFLFEKLLKHPHVKDVRSNFAIKVFKSNGNLPVIW